MQKRDRKGRPRERKWPKQFQRGEKAMKIQKPREKIDGRIKVNKSDLEWRTNWSSHNEAEVPRMHAMSVLKRPSILSQKSMHCVHTLAPGMLQCMLINVEKERERGRKIKNAHSKCK